jgi:hypothetical protein
MVLRLRHPDALSFNLEPHPYCLGCVVVTVAW